MVTSTPQSQAISMANQIFLAGQTATTLYAQIAGIDQYWTDDGVANILNAMATAPENTDGSLGTADGSPNNNHPIDTRVYPSLNFAVSSNQIASMKTILDAIQSLLNGNVVSAQGGARAILNAGH